MPDKIPGRSPRIVFLVYDLRSGSTLLSREMARRLRGVVVTPEIGFDHLLTETVDRLRPTDWPRLLDGLYAGHDFLNAPLSLAEARKIVAADAGNIPIAEGLRALIDAMASRLEAKSESQPPPQVIVVKNGTTLRHWDALRTLLGADLHLMFIYRDPRAVINSKLKTKRPYHPAEVMAWGGPLLAASQWQRYSRLARQAKEAGVRVTEVRYENLMINAEDVLIQLAGALEVDNLPTPREGAYRIPEAERTIHSLVEKGRIEADRVDGWTTELASADVEAIEALIGPEMQLRGYRPLNHQGPIARTLAIARGLPGLSLRLVRHAIYARGRSETSSQAGGIGPADRGDS